MKKVKLFLMFILGMLIFSINVKAADTYGIKCDKAYANEPFACSVTTAKPVSISTDLKVYEGSVSMDKNGTIKFKASKAGDYDISLISDDGETTYKTVTISVNEKTTTTTTKAKSDNNYLESITVNGEQIESFEKSKTKYFVEVENKVKKATIKATSEDDASTVTIDGPKVLEVGDNEYIISVKSESNTTKFYKVIVTRKDEEESSNTDIKSIKIRGYHLNFDKNSKTFYLNIKKEDTELDITVNTKDKKANYDIEGNENLEDGSVVKIVVTAQNGDTDTYRIIIQKESTNIIPYIIGALILIIIIVIIVVVMKNKKKKDNNKDDNKDKKSDGKKKPINKENKNNEDFENEKTIEMPPISEPKEKDNKESYEEEYDDDLDDEMVHIDNDEEEETRILSYAEREELERAKRQKEEEDSSDVSNKIDEELNKSLSFDYEYENDDEDDE